MIWRDGKTIQDFLSYMNQISLLDVVSAPLNSSINSGLIFIRILFLDICLSSLSFIAFLTNWSKSSGINEFTKYENDWWWLLMFIIHFLSCCIWSLISGIYLLKSILLFANSIVSLILNFWIFGILLFTTSFHLTA